MNSVQLRHEEWIPMADASELAGQGEAADLLQQGKSAPPDLSAGKPAAADSPAPMLGHGEIEALLKQHATRTGTDSNDSAATAGPAERSAFRGDGNIAPADIDLLISQAEQALASINEPAKNDPPPGVVPFKLLDFSGAAASTENATIDLIRDVELDVKIELGRTHMFLEDVLKLSKGAVVPLDKLAGDPVDIYVNGRLIARGEVLILNDNFCVRVAELVAGEEPTPT
jgi:flagellar motor switch protein FliN